MPRAAETEQDFAAVLTEISAPEEGLLPHLVQSLITTWVTWGEHRRQAGLDEGPADQLMKTTSSLSNHAQQITQIRNQAARHTRQPPLPERASRLQPPRPLRLRDGGSPDS
ncbi:hypothetical protein [Streptomyces sp. 840.1]|uniref:hypothetical protein n=1 Tax=Streptomyces sp. 840.1 TaxID=2485152 RepID=UPI0011CEABC8|nr:hypothetical protein [Streptomyces sp. 840.1]